MSTPTAFHYAHHDIPLPDNHRYPLPRYRQLYNEVIGREILPADHVVEGQEVADEILLLAHTSGYIEQMKQGNLTRAEERRLGLPWSELAVRRARRIVGATSAACRAALNDGVSFVLGGGTHHAFADFGSGFCIFNDVAVAARLMRVQGHVERMAVIDCDVHQGDGTAAILQNDTAIFTFSVHGENNFPFAKQRSDLDIGLPDGTGDKGYLAAVRRGLKYALQSNRPELVIYIAGADAYEGDRLGRLAVTPEGLAQRDRHVLASCKRMGLPVVMLMGGGYARPLTETVALNLRSIQLGLEIFG